MGNFTPSLFIGVGGVGKNILLRIRRMVIENHKKFETLPSIRFLHVDTDVNPGPDAGSSMPIEVMGQKLQFNDSEKCDLARRITQEIEQGKDIVKENPAVKEWFDDSLQLDLNFKDGAGGIRPYGRLAFHYSVNIFRERVANAVSDAKNQLNLQKTAETLGMSPDNNLGIYVVCSLLGGTGSGSFLEVCYNAFVAAKERGVTPYIVGVFVIGGNVDERRRANCYSALMEIEYHSTAFLKGINQHFSISYPLPIMKPVSESGAPVNLCYLVSHLGEGGYLLERDEMEEAIALNLYMEFGSIISNEKRSRRVDFTGIQEFQELDDEMKRSRQFLSFGISTLEFPAPRVQDMMAHELACFVVKGWFFEEKKESPELDRDIKELKERLEENALITDLLTIDNKNLLQKISASMSDQESKVRNLIEAPTIDADLILTTLNSNINTNIESVNFSMDSKLCGEYARQIAAKSYDRQKDLSAVIAEKVNYLVENEYRGPREAKAYLHAVYRFLTDRINAFEGKYNSFEKSSRRAQEPIYAGVQKLRSNIGKDKFAMNHHNRKIHNEFLASYMNLSLKREANRAAHDMLKNDRSENGNKVSSLLSLVESLGKELEEYTQNLMLHSANLDARRQEIESTIIGTPIAEGIKLTPTRLKEIAKGVLPNPSSHIVPLMNYVKSTLSEKDKDGDIVKQAHIVGLMLKRKDEVESVLIQRCSEICEGVRKISVASELKDKANIVDILSHKIRLSKPMIQAAGFKRGEDVRLSWLGTAEPKADLKIICDAINNVYQYKGSMKDRHLENLPDPYRIIFASEKGIFPLRRITMLTEYRKDYRMIKPKQTDARIKYPDILPTTEEDKIRERSEHALLLGKFFGFISEGVDPISKYNYVYLSYFDEASRTTEHEKISDNWEAVEQMLAAGQIEKEIDKKKTGRTLLERVEELIAKKGVGATTKNEREELWNKLQEYLEKVRRSCEGSDMNPEYQRQKRIVQFFRDKYALKPPEGSMEQGISVQTALKSTEKSEINRPTEEGAEKIRAKAGTAKESRYKEVLTEHFKKGIKDKERLMNYGMRFVGLSKEKALQIFDEALLSYESNDATFEQRLKAYKECFEFAIMDNEISEEERQTLKEKQKDLGLTDEEVRQIEKEFTESLYLELFQLALTDNIIEPEERKYLKDIQVLLNLDDKQVRGIESNFVFEEV